MIRLFKHYIPHAVLLLGLIDLGLLMMAGDFAWRLRAEQLGMASGPIGERLHPLALFTLIILTAMIAVGVYGADALRSVRFASARLLVAISLGIITLAVLNSIAGGYEFWRSTLFYAMVAAIVLLVANRLLVGAFWALRPFGAACWCWVRARAPNVCAIWPRADRQVLPSSATSV
jgi:FlaA1/EpsC-like NDP-sugar epimerase